MSQPWSMKSRASQSSSSGWRGRRALAAEVLGRGDEAAAEEVGPQPVDEDAGRERMVGGGEPAGQAEAIARGVCGERREHLGERVAADAVRVASSGRRRPRAGGYRSAAARAVRPSRCTSCIASSAATNCWRATRSAAAASRAGASYAEK